MDFAPASARGEGGRRADRSGGGDPKPARLSSSASTCTRTHAVPAWNLFEPAAARRRSAALHCQPFGLATLPRAGTPWEGKRGAEVWPCAPLLFNVPRKRTAAARRKSGSLL